MRQVIVGRARERLLLDTALARAASGSTTLLTIEGEAGIGKSTLLGDLKQRGITAGFRCLSATADEFERTRPFGALLDALSDVADAAEPRAAVLAMLRATPDMATPLVLASVPDLRHQVIDALCTLVEHLALIGPLLLVVDDAHWADASTLLALRSIARRVEGYGLLVAVAGRANPSEREWPALIGAATDTILVAPLDPIERHTLVTSRLQRKIGPNLVDLVAGTGGNPLLLDQLVRGLTDEQLRPVSDGALDVPAGFVPSTFTAGVRRSLDGLAPLTVEVLRAAAILGDTSALADVSGMIGRPAARLLAAVEDGIRAGILASDGPDLAFRHSMVRSAVGTSIPAVVRAALHREAADVLMARHAPAAAIASHLEAAGDKDEAALRSWLRRAADDAMGRSPAVAHELLGRARRGLDSTDPEWVELAVTDLEATANSGMLIEAELLGRELLGSAMEPDQRARVRWWLGGALFLQQRSVEAAELFELAAEEFEAPERRSLLRAYSALARLAAYSPSTGPAVERAVAAAEANGDAASMSLALSLSSRVLGSALRFREALEPALRAVRIADADRSGMAHRFQPSWFLALALCDVGRADDALDVIQFGRRRAAAAGASWAESLYHGLNALVLYELGRNDEADVEAAAGIAAADETGSRISILWCHAIAALVALGQGRHADAALSIDAGEAAFAAGQGQMGIDLVVLGRARLLAAQGKLHEARDHLEQSWTVFEATTIEVSNEQISLDLIDFAVRNGAGAPIRTVLDATMRWAALDPRNGRLGAMARTCDGIARGDAAAVADGAAALRRANRMAAADRADEIVHRLRGTTNVLIGPLGSDLLHGAAPITTGWAQLSPAEQRVCLAVGRGMSNKAIAAELFLSIRTVETHVSRILRKMDASSRLKLGLMVRDVSDSNVSTSPLR